MRPCGLNLGRSLLSPSRARLAVRLTPRTVRLDSSSATPSKPRRPVGHYLGLLAVFTGSAALAYNFPTIKAYALGELAEEDSGSEPKKGTAPRILIPKRTPESDNREHDADSLKFYQAQVEHSLRQPGLYVWGSNKGLVAAPDAPGKAEVTKPRRIPYFNGMVLRDVKLTEDFGVAVTEEGDLVQWGKLFAEEVRVPEVTLTGKNIVQIGISTDRIIALSANGTVYSIPVSEVDQETGRRADPPKSWNPLWSPKPETISYRILTPQNLSRGETITHISSGVSHVLLLTSAGRVFSAAASTSLFPMRSQMGIPGLTWENLPPGPYDQPHLVPLPTENKIIQIATGDMHSLALDSKGKVFAFGDNSWGQLGSDVDTKQPHTVGGPVAVAKLPKVTSIAAGGQNSFFTVSVPSKNSKVTKLTEIWAAGKGLSGTLGVGSRPHFTREPSRIKALSGLREWDERRGVMSSIVPARISVGFTQACAVLKTATELAPAPAYFWGGNALHELGALRGKTIDEPTQLPPLDGGNKGDKGEQFGPRTFVAVPRGKAVVGEGQGKGKGRRLHVEQRVECGKYVTGAYLAVV